MNAPLFQGKLVRLVAYDPEVSAEAFARWSQDSEYLRLLSPRPARPERAKRIKEDRDKKESKGNTFAFMIRTLADDRLIGFISLDHVYWTHGDAWLGIAIGEREDWGKGYGTDALYVILRYAFTELNLFRVSLGAWEYNLRAIRSYQKAGFITEGHMRGFLNRDGRRWDAIHMGILRSEWEHHQPPGD